MIVNVYVLIIVNGWLMKFSYRVCPVTEDGAGPKINHCCFYCFFIVVFHCNIMIYFYIIFNCCCLLFLVYFGGSVREERVVWNPWGRVGWGFSMMINVVRNSNYAHGI